MNKTPAILSLLHQDPSPASVTRQFRGQSVLRWTIQRLSSLNTLFPAILCWEDQSSALRQFQNLIPLPRIDLPSMRALTASRRWADGWRGGLLSATCFDLGFHAPSLLAAMEQLQAEQIVLIDPDSALIDPSIVESLLSHAAAHQQSEYAFTPAACGQAAILLRRALIQKLAQSGTYPGRLLNYHPDVPGRDPIALPACAPVPTSIARATERFNLDSRRQIDLFERATHQLNGHLISSNAEDLLHLIRNHGELDFPRDVTLEINTSRLTRPLYSPLRYASIQRPDMSVETAREVFSQLARSDDLRLTIAGLGDPLLHPRFFDLLQAAADAGMRAIHVETDLLAEDMLEKLAVEKLAASPFDLLTVHIPAVTQKTYRQMMDADQLPQLIANMRKFLQLRGDRATPILVPTFTKCRENLAEMEPWYDHWIRHLGCAVIAGPGDCSAQIPDVAAADMSPPKRLSCRRLRSRMTILSNGQVVACENDIQGLYPLGKIGRESLCEIWRKGFGLLREEHDAGRYSLPICQTCRDWHRP